ncbi:MAG TPA: helical backbone metal receptor [Kofleriaceae bacterium]|nr:helical backbone metal receptor [Kofleriaceae bacterium]
MGIASGCGRSGSEPPAGAPRRVVATTPSATEIVAAVAGPGLLVGRDRFSNYPPEVKGLPVVGDFVSPSVEAILQLRPDLVVLDTVQVRTAEALRAGGIDTVVLEMHTVEDVLDGLSEVGRALGAASAAARARARLEQAIAAARARGRARARRPRVLLIQDREIGALRSLVACGPGSYLDELVTMLGAENVLANSSVRYPKISPETVIEAAPDVILDATFTADPDKALSDWSALPAVPAVAGRRVHMIGGEATGYFVSPGPRLDVALAGLEQLL